ncbi:hypothetical protein [Liberiplasma polymorphum]|uniref:hypothetical protein n=1 Tax=Liberiplasma polymorphum TaxID=3374570 RepID=UPI00377494C6
MKRIILIVVFSFVLVLYACSQEGYQQTEMELDGYPIYVKEAEKDEVCALWYSMTVYDGAEGHYVFLNHCPTSYAIKIDEVLVPLTSYIAERTFTYNDIEDFPLFIRESDNAFNDTSYHETNMTLKSYPVYVKVSDSDICAEWYSISVYFDENSQYDYFNHCPVVYYIQVDGTFVALENIINSLDLTIEEMDAFPLIVKRDLEESPYQETSMNLDGYEVFVKEGVGESCAMWYSMVIYTGEEGTYLFYNTCPIHYYVKVNEDYIPLLSYISTNPISIETIQNFPLFVKTE